MSPYAPLLFLLLLSHCAADETPRASDERSELVLARVKRDLSRKGDDLAREQRAGRQTIAVKSGFRHATIAVRGKDGAVRARCVDRPDQAERMLREGDE